MSSYDICDNQDDLDYLDKVEANTKIDYGQMELAHPELFTPNGPRRTINEEKFEIGVLELYQNGGVGYGQ